MCVPSDVRSRWLSEFSDKALRLLNAIEVLSVDGCTEPVSKAELMKIAGIKHRQSMTKALEEVTDDIAVMTISARKASYSLRCLLEQNGQPVIESEQKYVHPVNDNAQQPEDENVHQMNTTPERSLNEHYEETANDNDSVHQMNVTGAESSENVHQMNGNTDNVHQMNDPDPVCMYESIDHKNPELDLQPYSDSPPSQNQVSRAFTPWAGRRTATLISAAGFDAAPPSNPSENMRRWACEVAMAGQRTARGAAKQVAYNHKFDIDWLEECIDYWLYLRESNVEIPRNGKPEIPGFGWLRGHLENDYGINYDYHPLWRWPEERHEAEQAQVRNRFVAGKYADLIDNKADSDLGETIIDSNIASAVAVFQDYLETEEDYVLLPEYTDSNPDAKLLTSPANVYDVIHLAQFQEPAEKEHVYGK